MKTMDKELLQTEVGPVEIRRRRGRRRISIVMHPLRCIEVRANLSISQRDIGHFIFQRKDWIEKNLLEFKENNLHKALIEGESFPLFGRDRILTFKSSENPKAVIRIQDDKMLALNCTHHTSLEQLHKIIREFYKKTAIFYLQQRVEALSNRMGLFPSRLSFGEAGGLWGSCHRSGHIRLNWKLVAFRPEVIDYIVIHELAHLQFLNHSKSFWLLVKNFCPNFREYRWELKRRGLQASFLDKRFPLKGKVDGRES